MNYELKQGEKLFDGVLIECSEVKGTTKKDNRDFHFVKFNVDLNLIDKDGKSYTRLCEFIVDPSLVRGQSFEKYKKVCLVFEILNPLNPARLVKIFRDNN